MKRVQLPCNHTIGQIMAGPTIRMHSCTLCASTVDLYIGHGYRGHLDKVASLTGTEFLSTI